MAEARDVFLFPGQGSQAVGMLSATKDLPAVQRMLAAANDILGYDIAQVCLEGPAEKLGDTAFCQPAVFLGSLAAVERLRAEEPALVASVSRAAGLSLGEYSALVFAGAMSFEDGLRVVDARARSMAAAAKAGDQGMLAVVGLDDDTLEQCIAAALAQSPQGAICQVANFLFPKGDKAALVALEALALSRGATKVQMLAVSGAFHTELMEPAAAALRSALSEVHVQAPRIPVISNVTGEAFPDDASEIRRLLERQLVSQVKWEQTISVRTG